MLRYLSAVLGSFALAAAASAHMVYVVPSADEKALTVVFSDDLEPDENVPIAKVAGLKLTGRFAEGPEAAVELTAEKHALKGTLKAKPVVVFGAVDYGVMGKEGALYLLRYHPKAVLAGADEKAATLGRGVEIVPVADGDKTAFRVLSAGKPVADAEITVVTPDAKKEKLKTDKDGRTTAFAGTGRFAAYAKVVEPTAGELDGKKYAEIRKYATLVYVAGK